MKGGIGSIIAWIIASIIASLIPLNLGVGCAPSCWPIFGFRTSWVLAGAQRAVFCALRVADFLAEGAGWGASPGRGDRKSTRLNSSHVRISYAVFCLKKKNHKYRH